ncbi:hypothetical protein TNCV_997971 [Trichonephila clavipes]|nr:hypothetical protein TNCV_997971 [Trichonephila clavipes]
MEPLTQLLKGHGHEFVVNVSTPEDLLYRKSLMHALNLLISQEDVVVEAWIMPYQISCHPRHLIQRLELLCPGARVSNR